LYFLVRGILGLIFDVQFDPGFFWELAIVVVLGLLPILFGAYKQVSPTGRRAM
jgi:hypothetical protein